MKDDDYPQRFRSIRAAVSAADYSELTLGHNTGSVTARYSHHVDHALAAAADRVSAVIAARMAGREAECADGVEENDNVLPLRAPQNA